MLKKESIVSIEQTANSSRFQPLTELGIVVARRRYHVSCDGTERWPLIHRDHISLCLEGWLPIPLEEFQSKNFDKVVAMWGFLV